MKRVLESSPVTGYQLYRIEKLKADGTPTLLKTYYVRHRGIDTCLKTDRLTQAKNSVKKMAGEAAQVLRRRTERPDQVTIGALLDLVVEDYKANGHKTLANMEGQVKHSLRPFFGEIMADALDTDDMDRWLSWRRAHRLRKSVRGGHETLQGVRDLKVSRCSFPFLVSVILAYIVR
jgi:hypothetical protein